MAEVKRRDFLGMTLGGVTAVGAIASLVAMKKTWDPLPSVVSAGFTTVDVGSMKDNEYSSVVWRGKPVYIIRKPAGLPFIESRDFNLNGGVFTVGIQICTHLGCIPNYDAKKEEFFCPCHGGKYTIDGINIPGTPPPRPFDLPSFKIDSTKITFGESGPEYQKLVSMIDKVEYSWKDGKLANVVIKK